MSERPTYLSVEYDGWAMRVQVYEQERIKNAILSGKAWLEVDSFYYGKIWLTLSNVVALIVSTPASRDEFFRHETLDTEAYEEIRRDLSTPDIF